MIPGTHHGTLFLMLRRMRAPLILLIVILQSRCSDSLSSRASTSTAIRRG